MYLNAVVFNISKNENSQVCLFYYKLKFFNLVWTRFTFHNVTWLYYACHETSISVSVFDMTIYVTCINLHLCVCIICKFIFKGCYFRSLSCSLAGEVLAINNVTWYVNNSLRYAYFCINISSIVLGAAHFIYLYSLQEQGHKPEQTLLLLGLQNHRECVHYQNIKRSKLFTHTKMCHFFMKDYSIIQPIKRSRWHTFRDIIL